MSSGNLVPRLMTSKPGSGIRHLSLLFLAYLLVSVITLGANPFKGETVGPFDLLASYGGWNVGDTPIEVRNGERSDVLDAFVPRWTEAKAQILDGTVPFWNPLQGAGQAALFDPTKALFSVSFLLFLLIPSPAMGFYAGTLSSLVIAGLGMHLLVRRYCGPLPALFAGISYMMCGFITAWLFWPHTYSAIWIPWLLIAVGRCVERPSPGSVTAVAASTWMLVMGGFPFVIAIGLGAAFVHIASTALIAEKRGWSRLRATLPPMGGIGLGLALCAVPILTLMAVLQHIDIGYRSGGSAFSIEHMKLLLRPWGTAAASVERSMYVGMLALALIPLAALWAVVARHRALFFSASAYVVVGMVLTFGLLPQEIGARLPVLSNNPWSRAILLLSIGIILLAALGLDFLLKRLGSGKLALAAGVLAAGVQYSDLLQVFRQFNGPTPARYFFQPDDNVRALAQSAPPFQYVVQDGSHYLISGTLAAVGLGDWFGHSLRSPGQRTLLERMADNPFASPTATISRIESFKLDDAWMDISASCYFIYPSGGMHTHLLMRATPGQKSALPPFEAGAVTQHLDLQQPATLYGFSVRLATYRQHDLDGKVELVVRDLSRDAVVTRVDLPASRIRDNRMLTFEFPEQPEVPAGRYAFEFHYRPGPAAKRLTAWAFSPGAGLERNGEERAMSIDYVLHGSHEIEAVQAPFEVLSDNGRTTVARNVGCPVGPYWTANVGRPDRTMDDGAVSVSLYSPHAFSLDVQAPAEGHVIVPMNYQPGWQATVNGAPRAVELVGGVIPAIHVERGHNEVAMRYEPPRWRVGAAISGGALLLFGIASMLWRRRKRSAV